jgi:hypothetical protein
MKKLATEHKKRDVPEDPFASEDQNDPFVQVVRDLYAKADPEKRLFLLDSLKKSDGRWLRIRHWTSQLTECAKGIVANGENAPWYFVEFFWIRLYGLLEELPRQLSGLAERAAEHPKHARLQLASALFDAVQEVRSSLSDEEIVFLDYMRQRSSHLRQSSYEVRWDSKGLVADDGKQFRLIPGRTFSIVDIDKIIREMLERHQGDYGVASMLVQKLEKQLVKVILLVQQYTHDSVKKAPATAPIS